MLAGDRVTAEMLTADVGMQAVYAVTPETPTVDLVTPGSCQGGTHEVRTCQKIAVSS